MRITKADGKLIQDIKQILIRKILGKSANSRNWQKSKYSTNINFSKINILDRISGLPVALYIKLGSRIFLRVLNIYFTH